MADLDLPRIAVLLDIAERLREYSLTEHTLLRSKVQEELAKVESSLKPKESEKESEDEPAPRASVRGR